MRALALCMQVVLLFSVLCVCIGRTDLQRQDRIHTGAGNRHLYRYNVKQEAKVKKVDERQPAQKTGMKTLYARPATIAPTALPTADPTIEPSHSPSVAPTTFPTAHPTDMPSMKPTPIPSNTPTSAPTVLPTTSPSVAPSIAPTAGPTARPFVAPTTFPTIRPSVASTAKPTVVSTNRPTAPPSLHTGDDDMVFVPVVKADQARDSVDIFFYFDFVARQKYVAKEYFWILPKVAAMYSKHTDDEKDVDVRIHILSSSVDVLELSSSMGFYAHDLNFQVKVDANLRSRIEPTVLNERHEMKILRWRAYHEIVKEWNSVAPEGPIKRIVAVEEDVLLVWNALSLFDRAFRATEQTGMRAEMVTIAGYITLFTTQGLESFSHYINGWYVGSAADIKYRSVDAARREWSDALLLERYVTSNTTTRKFWFNPTNTTPLHEQNYDGIYPADFLRCVPLSGYKTKKGIRFELNNLLLNGSASEYGTFGHTDTRDQEDMHHLDRFDSLTGPNLKRKLGPKAADAHVHISYSGAVTVKSPLEAYPYCFMQFAERGLKTLMYAFGRGLEIASRGEEARVSSARDHLSGDMLVSPEGSREIYHIHSNGTRYFIPTLQSFNARGFSLDDIIPNIPMDIIKAFPFGPGGAHPWADGTAVQFHKNRIVYYVMGGGVLHPVGSNRVFERLNLKYEDIVKDNAHTGNVFSTLSFGPTITE